MTIRDLVAIAADMAGVANMDASIGGREMRSYSNALRVILTRLRLKKLFNPGIESKEFNLYPDSVGTHLTFKLYDADHTATDGQPIQDGNIIYVKTMIPQPDSVSYALIGSGQIVPMDYVDIQTMFQGIRTLYNDVSYPIYWAWNPGENPELWINGKQLLPPKVVVNGNFDIDMSLDWNRNIDSWPVGLAEVVQQMLAYQITVINGVADTAIQFQSKQLLREYEHATKAAPTFRIDPSAPGVLRGVYDPITKSLR
jgi:hypothetical protein